MVSSQHRRSRFSGGSNIRTGGSVYIEDLRAFSESVTVVFLDLQYCSVPV
jgi:hypothetical protein